MSLLRLATTLVLAALLGCSGPQAQASKPTVPMQVEISLAEEADGSWRVTTTASTRADFTAGELSVSGPGAAQLLRGDDHWEGELAAGETIEITGWYQLKGALAESDAAFRAKLKAIIGGIRMTKLGIAQLPGARAKSEARPAPPVKAGAEEYPSK